MAWVARELKDIKTSLREVRTRHCLCVCQILYTVAVKGSILESKAAQQNYTS